MEVSVASRWLAGCSGRVASTGNEFGLITSGRRRLERSEAGLLVQFVVCTTQSKSRAHVLLRPMSHLRFYRAIASHESATLSRTARLSSCTLRLRRINKHGFCTAFPVSRSTFTSTVPKWWNGSISNLFWTLRFIVRFRCARQPTKTKQHRRTLRLYRARNKIAR